MKVHIRNLEVTRASVAIVLLTVAMLHGGCASRHSVSGLEQRSTAPTSDMWVGRSQFTHCWQGSWKIGDRDAATLTTIDVVAELSVPAAHTPTSSRGAELRLRAGPCFGWDVPPFPEAVTVDVANPTQSSNQSLRTQLLSGIGRFGSTTTWFRVLDCDELRDDDVVVVVVTLDLVPVLGQGTEVREILIKLDRVRADSLLSKEGDR